MISNPKRKNLSFLLHIMIWSLIGFLMFFFLPLTWGAGLPVQFWIKQLIVFLLLIALYYINTHLLVPSFLLKNRILLFVLSGLTISFFFMLIINGSDHWLRLPGPAELMKDDHFPRPPAGGKPPLNPFAALPFLFVLAISTSVTSIQKWQKDNQSRVLLEQDKISTELAYLKSQINPHFFFNTLNNIYALMHVNVEASKKALHTLSRMMRYLLYETQNEQTLLTKEIDFISDFVDLMKLRLFDNVSVIYNKPAMEEDYTVSPMLFLPFIENAFKHGIDLSRPSTIEITIYVRNDILQFTVVNTCFPPQEKTESFEKGIGLSNTKRRLALLYPGRHKLEIEHPAGNNIFKVNLAIQL